MATDQQHLQKTLEDLHRQLAETGDVAPELRQQLGAVLNDIQTVLSRSHETQPAPPKGADSSLTGRLDDAARHFEETHPTLSGTINSIVDTLARMGI